MEAKCHGINALLPLSSTDSIIQAAPPIPSFKKKDPSVTAFTIPQLRYLTILFKSPSTSSTIHRSSLSRLSMKLSHDDIGNWRSGSTVQLEKPVSLIWLWLVNCAVAGRITYFSDQQKILYAILLKLNQPEKLQSTAGHKNHCIQYWIFFDANWFLFLKFRYLSK